LLPLPSSFCFYFSFSFYYFIFSKRLFISACRLLNSSSSCCFFDRFAYSYYNRFFSAALRTFAFGLLVYFSRYSLLVAGRLAVALLALDAARRFEAVCCCGAVSLSSSRASAGSSLYFLAGRGGRMAFCLRTTLASSKKRTSSSRVWNLNIGKST
jgi:hypothetical protein